MTVSEVMSPEVESVAPDTPIEAARDLMRERRIHHLVVTRGKNVLGLVSARDLGRRQIGTAHLRTVSDVMTRHLMTVGAEATLARASFMMRGRAIGCLLVLDRGRVAGIVTPSDLLSLLGRGAERRPRADTRTAIHHRVAHRRRSRGDGVW
jgi:CBS domain-containing protein